MKYNTRKILYKAKKWWRQNKKDVFSTIYIILIIISIVVVINISDIFSFSFLGGTDVDIDDIEGDIIIVDGDVYIVKNLQWATIQQFNYGTEYYNTEVVQGCNSPCIDTLQLSRYPEEHDIVPFTSPSNYTYNPTNINMINGIAKLNTVGGGATDSESFPFTSPVGYNYGASEIEVSGGEARLYNNKIDEQHNWDYTTLGEYSIYPTDSIDIVAGKAKLHDQGSVEDDDNIDYNTPTNYIYDNTSIEFNDKGGGNYASRLIAGAGLSVHGHWHLNEVEGDTVADSSGNGRDGTRLYMEDVDWVEGKLNNGLKFDGVDERVNFGNIGSFERTDSFSIEFWVNTTLRTQVFIAKWLGSTGWYIQNYAGQIYFTLASLWSSNVLQVRTPNIISDSTWHHFIVTYDGSSSPSGVKFYIDGLLKAGVTTQNSLTGSTINAGDCHLSGYGASGTQLFLGTLDEVVIYNQILTPEDVDYRWNEGNGIETMSGGFPTNDPTITSNFDAGFGTIVQWKNFITSSTKPSGTEIKYTISIDSGISWKWWDGTIWATADGSYAQSNIFTEMNDHIAILSVGNQLFRIKAFLHTTGTNTPELDNVNIVWYVKVHDYITDGKITTNIELNHTPDPLHSWSSFIETVLEPVNTEIRYVLSNDGGAVWLYWNGVSWIVSDGDSWSQFSTGTQISTNVGDFPKINARMKVKAYLKTTDTTVTPELNNIQVDYNYGYNYNINNPEIFSLFSVGSGSDPLLYWNSFSETSTKPIDTEIKYILSDDDGLSWMYWNGAIWSVSNELYSQSNTASEINTNIDSFHITNKKIMIDAFLHTNDPTKTPELDNILIEWTETVPQYVSGQHEIEMNFDIQPIKVSQWSNITENVIKPTNTFIEYQFSINEGNVWN